MDGSLRSFLLRFAPMIYGPTVLFALGEGAVIPLIPLMAVQLGADIAASAFVASALVVGQLCGNLPASYIVARLGERITMAGAGTVALAGVAGLIWAPNVGLLATSVFLIGMCAATFGLARHAFMTMRIPVPFRARALSLLGGSFRLGAFTGPFIGAAMLTAFGTHHAASIVFAVALVATVLLVLLGPDPEKAVVSENPEVRREEVHEAAGTVRADTGEPVTGAITLGVPRREGVFRTMRRYWGVLSRLGVAAAGLSAVRSARQVVLPLWGVSIGLDATTISLVVGVAGAIEFALFYASGQVMDKFGRLWAVLPSLVLMGIGFLALSLTHDGDQAAMWFAMLAAVIGVGNGLSSGILLTLGADVAPAHDPAPFLGSWRTLTDAGAATAPVVFSLIAGVATLGVATASMGVIGLVAALGFWRWMPRFVKRPEGR